jgi:2-keto-4-pentenoate hydratase/2-oxohepta-3-ene-1,7-dioic acid hydratase in catechol pathway
MTDGKAEVVFGIGTMLDDGKPATAVVVNDQVASLASIVARHSTPGAIAPVMRDFMPDWNRWHDWLRGLDLKPAPDEGWKPVDAVKFMAPVPEPWNIFQTYHNFERPSRITGRSDPPKHERVFPDMFMASRSSLGGYGDKVYREHGVFQFDFELEVTAVIGKPAYRVKAERADEYIAGYAIANDYTTHFSWWSKWREGRRTNDSIRMKNFPGYTPMSRVVVPRDLAGDPHDLARRRAGRISLTRDDASSGRPDHDRIAGGIAAAARHQEGTAQRPGRDLPGGESRTSRQHHRRPDRAAAERAGESGTAAGALAKDLSVQLGSLNPSS